MLMRVTDHKGEIVVIVVDKIVGWRSAADGGVLIDTGGALEWYANTSEIDFCAAYMAAKETVRSFPPKRARFYHRRCKC